MALNRTFNNKAVEGDYILARSEAARDSIDLTTRDVFQQQSASAKNWATMPKDGPTWQDRAESALTTSNDRSLAQKMRPDKSYEAPQIQTASLQRNSDQAVKDAPSVEKQAGAGLEQTAKTMAQFSADWNQAKGEAISALREAATEMEGVDADLAEAQLTPDPESTKMGAALTVAVDIAGSAMGGGSFVTFGAASLAARELASQTKPMGNETKEALLAKVLDKLKSESGNTSALRDSRVDGGGGPGVVRSAIDTTAREVHWENLTTDDLEAFLKSDPYGQDQPEFQALEDAMKGELGFENTLSNVEIASDDAGKKVSLDRVEAALERGDNDYVQHAVEVDSGDAILAGQMIVSLNGVKVEPDEDTLDVAAYVPVYEPEQPQPVEPEHEARQLMGVGM